MTPSSPSIRRRLRFAPSVGAALGALLFGGVAALVACGGGGAGGTSDAKLPEGTRSTDVEHEACNESGHKVESLDINGDKKPDLKKVYDNGTGKEICTIADLNHDGMPDMFEYFDASGQLRRREADYDGSGVVDSIEYYEGGKLVRRELDLSGQHKIDTWDFFDANGKLARRERDTTGDGRIDQWWMYDASGKVTIAFDKNNDGKPDPNDTVALGEGYGAPAQAKTADAAPPPSTASSLGAGLLDAGASSSSAPQSADASILPTSSSVTGVKSTVGGDAGASGKGGKKK